MNKIIMDWVGILKWPFTVILITCIIIYVFKRSLSSLIGKINKFNVGKFGVDVSQVNQTSDTTTLAHPITPPSLTSPAALVSNADSFAYINRILAFFAPATIDQYKNGIEHEIHLSGIVNKDEKIELLSLYSQAVVISLNFERIYNRIFGSQMFLLENLNNVGSESRQSLQRFYNDASVQFPEAYKSFDFSRYLSFLIDMHLVIVNNDIFEISTIGRDFLKFLVETQKSMAKSF
jgi:hypothetical protein